MITISQGFAAYNKDVISFSNQSAKTEEASSVACHSLVLHVGDKQLSDLTFEDVKSWKTTLEKQGKCTNTIRGYIIKLRVVLAYMKKTGRQALDPDIIPVPKRQEKVPKFLTPEEVTILIDSTSRIKNKAIISFLYASGLRISELCRLDKGSIKDRSFTVIGKGGQPRLCFIDERTETLVKLYLETRTDNSPALFMTDMGTRMTPGTVQETFKTVRKRSGIECHPHTLRHSFATNLLRTNTNLFYVSKFLGHKSLNTTQQYLHLIDNDLEKVYKNHHHI